MSPMNSVELFTGCGGLALGLAQAGFHHALVVERDRSAHQTLLWNKSRDVGYVSGWQLRLGDVCDVDWSTLTGQVDLVAGGPPCQPFSIGGSHRGPDDERNAWPEAIRAIWELKPAAFVFENVRGLLRPSFSDYLTYLQLALGWPGSRGVFGEACWRSGLLRLRRVVGGRPPTYQTAVAGVNAADYGAPQTRHRAIILGVRHGSRTGPLLPPPTHSRAALLWDQHVSRNYWERHGLPPRAPLTDGEARIVNSLVETGKKPSEKPWVTVRDVIADLPGPTLGAEPLPGHRLHPGARVYPRHTGSDWDAPAKALKAGAHGVPGGENILIDAGSPRYFTLREMLRLQGFPDEFEIPGGGWKNPVRQIGNAVPVQVGRAFGVAIAAAIGRLDPGLASQHTIRPDAVVNRASKVEVPIARSRTRTHIRPPPPASPQDPLVEGIQR